MPQLEYTLKQPQRDERDTKRYRRSDLESMTTYQLREICRREKLIHGVVNQLDADELIHVILRDHGMGDEHLITKQVEGGKARLEELLTVAKQQLNENYHLDGSATIVVFENRATSYYDKITMAYDPRFSGTNALVVSGDNEVCGVFNIMPWGMDRDRLYLTCDRKLGECMEASKIKNYSLYCFDSGTSELVKSIYNGEADALPEFLTVYRMPILDFAVRNPAALEIPLAIDFGTTNTAAGVYLDNTYFENIGERPGLRGLKQESVNYSIYYDTTDERSPESVILPSVVAVKSLAGNIPQYAFGFEAVRLANSIYTDEETSVFYDIKRWITDFEKEEPLTDRQGRYMLVARKDIVKAFLEHVISQAEDRFKCTVPHIHISAPVKQRHLFRNLIGQIMPQYASDMKETLDEGVTVLYNTISERIVKDKYEDGVSQRALIIDCGGGTTDLTSCVFTIEDKRVSYDIALETTYENGDTNFGGNNLTFRIMQLLKIKLAAKLGVNISPEQVIQSFDTDTFRFVDEHGVAKAYEILERAYDIAERTIPTQFKNFEGATRKDYFKVKSNFYFLFQLADKVKKVFFGRTGTLLIHLGEDDKKQDGTAHIWMDRWKLSVLQQNKLEVLKTAPDFTLNLYDIESLLKADIYGIVQKFLQPQYEADALYDYSAIKLSGQSCKIGLFADAIKEFIPGKIIQFRRAASDIDERNNLDMKLACVEGALQYLRDKKYGFANVKAIRGKPALPYEIAAEDHHGKIVKLIHHLDRDRNSGSISRNMDNLTLKLHLNDADSVRHYVYTYQCKREEFKIMTFEELEKEYPHIPQDETDTILDNEAKFFVWADTDKWGFFVLPVTRISAELRVGIDKFFPFESDSWVLNFFDGTR